MTQGPGLSEAAQLVWGKTGDGSKGMLPLWRHLADSADVAGRLWDEWLPEPVRRRICDASGDGDGRVLVRWLAGVHDIGKATPAFAVKSLLWRDMQAFGFSFDPRVAGHTYQNPNRVCAAQGPDVMVQPVRQRTV